MNDAEISEAHRILKSRDFKFCNDGTECWFSLEQRKHFSRKSIRSMSLEGLRARLEENVPEKEFWFFSYQIIEPHDFQRLISKYELSGCTPISKPAVVLP